MHQTVMLLKNQLNPPKFECVNLTPNFQKAKELCSQSQTAANAYACKPNQCPVKSPVKWWNVIRFPDPIGTSEVTSRKWHQPDQVKCEQIGFASCHTSNFIFSLYAMKFEISYRNGVCDVCMCWRAHVFCVSMRPCVFLGDVCLCVCMYSFACVCTLHCNLQVFAKHLHFQGRSCHESFGHPWGARWRWAGKVFKLDSNNTICLKYMIFYTTRGLYLVLSPTSYSIQLFVCCWILYTTYSIQLQGGQDWTGWRWGAPCNWHCGAEVETFWSLWRGFLWRKNQSASFFQRLGEEKSPPTEHQNRWCIPDPLPSVP